MASTGARLRRSARVVEQQAGDRDAQRELAARSGHARELGLRDAQPFFGAVEDSHVEILQLLPDVDALGMDSGDRLELGGTARGILELVAADLGDALSQRCAFGLRQASRRERRGAGAAFGHCPVASHSASRRARANTAAAESGTLCTIAS